MLFAFNWQVLQFQASTLDESHYLPVILLCKNACENLDAINARSAACFLQPILQLCKTSSWPPLKLRFLHLLASDIHHIGVARGAKGSMAPLKILEHIVILCFERRFSKQNSFIRLKSNILSPQIFGLHWYTNTRSIEAQQLVCFKTPTPEVGLQNLRACKVWILSNAWATGRRMQLIT